MEEARELGCAWWPLQLARELDDAILLLRTNELELGIWVLKTRGDAAITLAHDDLLHRHRAHWWVRETIGLLRRTLARFEVSSRSLLAIVDEKSNFTGTLAELLFAADRSFMLSGDTERAPRIALSPMNFGGYETVEDQTRLAARFYADAPVLAALSARQGEPLDGATALELGLVTIAPDELDWDDEIRLALEERASLSPDALSGLEASLRCSRETMSTRIFGRLSAWQNWIFNRPNAVGEQGALKVFGSGAKARFDRERI
jgi:benzoyl-CoA-dihydrodiol lyase